MANDIGELVSGANPSMLIVTAAHGSEMAGCLVGFHSQCSIDPAEYAVWLSKANHTYHVALQADFVGIHFLTAGEKGLAELFGSTSGDSVEKFSTTSHHLARTGVPLLDECANQVVAARVALIDEGGDHVCFVVRPRETWLNGLDLEPLRLRDVSDVTPGHQPDEREDLTR